MHLHGKDLKIFTANSNPKVAEDIATALGLQLSSCEVKTFSDGEIAVSVKESVRGSDVFLVQSTSYPVNDHLMELLILTDAMRRASANRITAVIPYFGYARQDRKAKSRDPISAKLVADLLTTAGVDRVLTMDLHAAQIQGFFDIPVDHLYASTVYVPFIKSLNIDNLVIASPDIGGSKRAHTYAKHLDVPLVLCHKTREKANVVSNMSIIGDVKDKNILIVDDMADTAGTLCKAADLMMDNGARSVRAMVTHPVMSGKAIENVMNSKMSELIFTDSIPFDQTKCPKVRVISVADMFAETITQVYNHESISAKYLL